MTTERIADYNKIVMLNIKKNDNDCNNGDGNINDDSNIGTQDNDSVSNNDDIIITTMQS